MTQEEIIEGNKLIAEFMGLKLFNEYTPDLEYWWAERKDTVCTFNGTWCSENPPPFNTSWDWLMPIVQKIETCFEGNIQVIIKDTRCHIEMGTQYALTLDKDIDVPDCYHGFCKTKIEAVWQAVVAFTKWLNSDKNVQECDARKDDSSNAAKEQ